MTPCSYYRDQPVVVPEGYHSGYKQPACQSEELLRRSIGVCCCWPGGKSVSIDPPKNPSPTGFFSDAASRISNEAMLLSKIWLRNRLKVASFSAALSGFSFTQDQHEPEIRTPQRTRHRFGSPGCRRSPWVTLCRPVRRRPFDCRPKQGASEIEKSRGTPNSDRAVESLERSRARRYE